MNNRRMNANTLEVYTDNVLVLSMLEKKENGFIVVEVSGDINNEVAHEFEDEIMALISVFDKVKIDMGNVTYIASLAMKALLSVQQIIDEKENSEFVLTNLSENVRENFELSGLSDVLYIEE